MVLSDILYKALKEEVSFGDRRESRVGFPPGQREANSVLCAETCFLFCFQFSCFVLGSFVSVSPYKLSTLYSLLPRL